MNNFLLQGIENVEAVDWTETQCNCVIKPNNVEKSTTRVGCALDTPKKNSFSVIPIHYCGGTKQQHGWPFGHACDTAKNDKNKGWALDKELGSRLDINFDGSFFLTKMEIQTGYDNVDHCAKEFHIGFKADDRAWQRPKNVSVTAENGIQQVATYDGNNFKMIGNHEVNLVITFDVIEAHVIHFYVYDSYNGKNAIINEVTLYGPGKKSSSWLFN